MAIAVLQFLATICGGSPNLSLPRWEGKRGGCEAEIYFNHPHPDLPHQWGGAFPAITLYQLIYVSFEGVKEETKDMD